MARISYLTLLRRPPTLLLWLGQFVSTAGDWLYLMAAAWMTYKVTGSPAAMSAVAIAAIVPSLIVGFVGGALLDRWPPLRTLALIDLVRGLLVATPYHPYRQTTLVLRLATGDLVRRLEAEPTCSLARLPATSRLLGKMALSPTGAERPLYQRELLELLEAEPEVSLPCRYAVAPAADGYDLHVLAPNGRRC